MCVCLPAYLEGVHSVCGDVPHHAHQAKLPSPDHPPHLQVLKPDRLTPRGCRRRRQGDGERHRPTLLGPALLRWLLLLLTLLLCQQLLRRELLLQLLRGNLLLLEGKQLLLVQTRLVCPAPMQQAA